jgi:muramoyltetrapeptide carboxypeptidase
VPPLAKPRALRPGGTIGIAAPAFPIDPKKLASGEEMWRRAGFQVQRRDDLLNVDGFLAGDDARRSKELSELFADPQIDVVVCARGGYGCHRIVSMLDARRVRAARKPLVGYSDITTLLLWQRRCAGMVGFHGPMLEKGDHQPAEALAALVAVLTGASPGPVLRGRGFGGGRAEGRLVGGNLVTLVASLGTPWEIDTRGAILLFEEIGERPYRIDRLVQQLRAAGKLDAVAGVGVGSLSGCDDSRYPQPSAEEVVAAVVGPLRVPLVLGLPFGHGVPNLAWPFGVRGRIDGELGIVEPLERGVVGTE